MRSTNRPVTVSLLAYAMLLVVVLWTRGGYAQPAALVSVDAVIQQAFTQTIPITGRLKAKQTSSVASRIDGTVATLHVQVGERVMRAQILARLDTATLELQQALASAKLQAANAQLILSAQQEKRLSELTLSAAISQAAYDDARQQHKIAAARKQEASVALKLAELALEHAAIRAPFAGVVTERATEAGSYLRRGDTVIRLVSIQQLEAEADIPYNRLAGVPPASQVEIRLDNGSSYSATVRAVVPEQNASTRTQRVRFAVDFGDAAGALAAEQSIHVLVPISQARDIVSVHKDAVIRRGSETIVFVVADDIATSRSVRLGEASGSRIEVLQGLEPAELVVVRGNERIRSQQKVIISNRK